MGIDSFLFSENKNRQIPGPRHKLKYIMTELLYILACSKTWSDLVWSHFIGLVWSLWTFPWSSLYFSLFHYFFFVINIINHNVTYWCCLFYNSHSDDLYQYFLCSIYDLILFIFVSITK